MKTWQDLTDMFKPEDVNPEMVKKYKNTYLGIRSNNGVAYGKYVGYSGDKHHFIDSNGVSLILDNDTQASVYIPTLTSGLYNTNIGVVYVSRNPFRQYRRGLCSDNVRCCPLINVIQYNESNYFDSVMWDIFNEVPLNNLHKAYEVLQYKPNVAVNRDFAIQRHHNKQDGHALFFKTSYIGDFTEDKIVVRNTVFLQEVVDSQHLWCPNHTIVG